MNDEPQKSDVAVIGPAVAAASQTSIAITSQEVIMTFGVARQVYGGDGLPNGQMVREWLTTYSLSPTTAKMLLAGLTEAIATYETTYGAIPMDASFKLEKAGTAALEKSGTAA